MVRAAEGGERTESSCVLSSHLETRHRDNGFFCHDHGIVGVLAISSFLIHENLFYNTITKLIGIARLSIHYWSCDAELRLRE